MIHRMQHNNLIKILTFLFVFTSVFLGYVTLAKPAQAETWSILCGDLPINNNDELDAFCTCPKMTCRLSRLGFSNDFNGNDKKGQGTNRVLMKPGYYLCVSPGSVLDDSLNGASKYKGCQDLDGKGCNEIYNQFYVDEYSRLPNNQNIPKGAVCKIANGLAPNDPRDVAYWYNPNYFDTVDNQNTSAGLVQCTPLFVQKDIFGKPVTGVKTFFGCLPGSINGAIAFAVRLILGLTGFVTFIIILVNLLKIVANSTNPDVVADGRKKLTSAVVTFIVLLLSLTILNVVGLQLLDLGSFGGGVLNLVLGRG